MAPYASIVARANNNSSHITPTIIGGFCFAGFLVLVLVIWLGVHIYRKQSRTKREEKRSSAFLTIRGVVKDDNHSEKSNRLHKHQKSQGQPVPRIQVDPPVTSPVKANTRDDIIEYHRQSGNTPRPFSFALAAGGNSRSPSPESNRNSGSLRPFSTSSLAPSRDSFLSVVSSDNRLSTVSTISLDQAEKRKVRQIFDPVLPDELVISLGEYMTIMQAFDDGWCIVGRSAKKGDNVELGAVPAWCFIKPVNGLRAERPMRLASLSVTVQVNQSSYSSRDQVISWSNF